MSWTAERARVASLTRSRTPDDPDLIAARQALRAARAQDYIEKLVDSAPPLTDEQRTRLAVLLRPEPPGNSPPQVLAGTTRSEAVTGIACPKTGTAA